MTLANRLIGTFFFLTITSQSHAIGLGDWTCKTPEGNSITNTGGIFLELKNRQVLEGLDNWYFYKSSIVGQRHNYSNHNKSYFVVNENTYTIDTFQTKKEWSTFINTHDLKPYVWTRQYDSDWQFFDDDIIFFGVVFFYISIPFLFFLFWLGYKALKQERLNFKKPYTLILTVILAFTFCAFLLEQFPQSI